MPPFYSIARPIATEHDENTDIMVSVDAVFRLPILFKRSANTIANITMASEVSAMPHTTPTAVSYTHLDVYKRQGVDAPSTVT